MPLKAILKLIGLQPIPVKKRKPEAKRSIPAKKRKPEAKRREPQTEEWELIGHTWSYGMTYEEALDQVPEWLKREWNSVRSTTRTLGGKWKVSEDIEDPEPNNLNEGYSGTGYFRNGKKFRYMIFDWAGMMGSAGTSFYRKHKR